MIKLDAMPIYGKHPFKIFFSGTSGPILTKLCMKLLGVKPIIVCSHYKAGLTLTYFTVMSNFVTRAFVCENVAIMDSLEMIAAFDLECD